MEPDFWHERWARNEIGFHEPHFNVLLTAHFDKLQLQAGARVFVPLCGKTLDIAWLLQAGYRVAGAELSELAVKQLFASLGVTPAVESAGKLKHYRAQNLDIFVGDIFDLSAKALGAVDACYDRAALVALPASMRPAYTRHLMMLIDGAPQLLVCFEYDQSQLEGPPFAVDRDELKVHYANTYDLQLIETHELSGGLKGKCRALEIVWLLRPR